MTTSTLCAALPLALVASAGLVACAPCPPPPPQQAASHHHHHGPPPGAHGDHGAPHGADHGRPPRGPKGKRHDRKPPKEAFAACAELQAGAECTVKTPHGDEAGTCFAPPNVGELACRPNKPRREAPEAQQRRR